MNIINVWGTCPLGPPPLNPPLGAGHKLFLHCNATNHGTSVIIVSALLIIVGVVMVLGALRGIARHCAYSFHQILRNILMDENRII